MKPYSNFKRGLVYSLLLGSLTNLSFAAQGDVVVKEENSASKKMSTGEEVSIIALVKSAQTGALTAYLTRAGNNKDAAFKEPEALATSLNANKIKAIQDRAQIKINAQKESTKENSTLAQWIKDIIQDTKRPLVLLKLDQNMFDIKIREAQQANLGPNLYAIQKVIVDAADAPKFLDPKFKILTIDVNRNGGMQALQTQLADLKAKGILIPEATVQTWAKRVLLNAGGKLLLVVGSTGAAGIYGYEQFNLNQAHPDAAYCDAGSSGNVKCAKAIALKKDDKHGSGRAPAYIEPGTPAY